MILGQASTYLWILWPSEFVLPIWTSAETGQSINRMNWTHLLVIQSGNPDKMESLEIVLLEIESLAESFLRAVERDLRK